MKPRRVISNYETLISLISNQGSTILVISSNQTAKLRPLRSEFDCKGRLHLDDNTKIKPLLLCISERNVFFLSSFLGEVSVRLRREVSYLSVGNKLS